MLDKRHRYQVCVRWVGNTGAGTRTCRGYERAYRVEAAGKPTIADSADPAFRGDPACWNLEELPVASLSACHKLWFLGPCSQASIVVTGYEDMAEGVMVEHADGAGQFESVTLRPRVTVSHGADAALVAGLHGRAHAMCFIARSVNFPVTCQPTILRDPVPTPGSAA